jgi:hypothetical protein
MAWIGCGVFPSVEAFNRGAPAIPKAYAMKVSSVVVLEQLADEFDQLVWGTRAFIIYRHTSNGKVRIMTFEEAKKYLDP